MGIEGEGRVGLAWPDPAELLPLGHSMDFGFFFCWERLGSPQRVGHVSDF